MLMTERLLSLSLEGRERKDLSAVMLLGVGKHPKNMTCWLSGASPVREAALASFFGCISELLSRLAWL